MVPGVEIIPGNRCASSHPKLSLAVNFLDNGAIFCCNVRKLGNNNVGARIKE